MPVSRFVRGSAPAPTEDSIPAFHVLDLAATKTALRIDGDEFDAMLLRLLETARQRVEREAPTAPIATRREAIILYVGWLFDMPSADELSMAGVFRRSGAQGLLSPWKVRRGGVIGA